MNSTRCLAEGVYRHLPLRAQDMAFALQKRRLARWRYGPGFHHLLEALTASQWELQPSQVIRQETLLRSMLHIAQESSPYYRSVLKGQRAEQFAKISLADLPQLLPVTSKMTVRRSPQQFYSSDLLEPVRVQFTSGSTGSPLPVLMSRTATQAQWSTWWRFRRRFGATLTSPIVQFGARVPVLEDPTASSTNRPFRYSRSTRELYVSHSHLTIDNLPAVLSAMESLGSYLVTGYPSAIHEFVRLSTQLARPAPGFPVAVLTGSEPLGERQRRAFQIFFGAPVSQQYGMNEFVGNASECERLRLHVDAEVGILEVLRVDSDIPVEPGEMGRLVFTGLRNRAMPLLRYDTGDLGRLSTRAYCGCGRRLPVLDHIEGRSEAQLRSKDGRLSIGLNQVLEWLPGTDRSQLIQHADHSLLLIYEPVGSTPPDAVEHVLRRELSTRLGSELDLRVSPSSSTPFRIGPTGKFESVISDLSTQ